MQAMACSKSESGISVAGGGGAPPPAGAGHPAAVSERVCLYPFGDLPAAAGREFPLQPAPQGDGQGHDPHHGTRYGLCPRRGAVAETQIRQSLVHSQRLQRPQYRRGASVAGS